jgi:predicted Holliday junction resolvase-like endonuclease
MDLTLFIILVILILSVIYLINMINELNKDIKYIKGFFENTQKPTEVKLKKENKNLEEVVEMIKEVFFNYLRK